MATTNSADDTAARLRALEDRAGITDVVNRYGEGVRTGDAELVASCFATDATIDHGHGQVVTGIGDIRKYFAGQLESTARSSVLTFDDKVASTPVMSNVLIELDGDEAHCESMCLAIHVGYRDGQGVVMVRGTRNIDDLVRTEEGWKIRRRSHPAIWAFEVPGSALVEH
jgi:ketosteroid isomerase-like protein